MPFVVSTRRADDARTLRAHPDAVVVDVTSRGPEPWVRFSPFFPHGGIPVPFTPGRTAASVEGIWQALLVFERAGVDPSRLAMTSMLGIKRASRVLGAALGVRAGLEGDAVLTLEEARRAIFLPSYRWVLEHRLAGEVEALRALGASRTVVLLDYPTRGAANDPATPIPHAGVLREYLLGPWRADEPPANDTTA